MLFLELFTRIHNNRSSTMISNFRYCASWLEFGGLTSSMSKNRDTVVTVGFGQGSKVDSVPMGSQMTHIPEALTGQRGPGKPQSSGPRHGRLMHQSTLSLGDPQGSGTSYTTTHTQSYCGREADGQPLVFFLRDPAYPSQHTSQLDLSHTSTSQLQTHSRDIHNTKDIIPFNVLHRLGQSNWSRNREGVAMREVTNPKEPTPYWTTYRSEHRSPSPSPSPHDPTGRPTLWHQHDILTGETRTPAGPGNARRQSGERVLWATRRWETDCCSFRLY